MIPLVLLVLPEAMPFSMLKLPTARAKQLRLLARARNTTMSGLIGDLINSAIANGELTDETPGLRVESYGLGGLSVYVDNEKFRMHFHEAEKFVLALKQITEDGGTWRAADRKRKFEIRRIGTGLIFEIIEQDRLIVRTTINFSLAKDLHRQAENVFRHR